MTARDSQLRTLLLQASYTTRLSYFDDWVDAFRRAPAFDLEVHDVRWPFEYYKLRRKIREADLIVLHHSTNGDTTRYLRPYVPLLQARRSLLLSFVGNEVNLPGCSIAEKRRLFKEIEPDFIATQLLLEAGRYLFGDLVRRAVIAVPHALNPQAFKPVIGHEKRTLDIGVRSVRYLPHLGDDDRNRLYDFFATRGSELGLTVDIDEERLDRAAWARFLNSCRGTVSCEAGSWYLERDDRTVEAIRAWTRERCGRGRIIGNDSALQGLGHLLPWRVRVGVKRLLARGPIVHESQLAAMLPFEEVYRRFFAARPRTPVYGKAASSRHFDAIGTKTCQIMFPGRYNDILIAGEHYIALRPDFSNLDEALEKFRDPGYRQSLVDRTLEYALAAHTHDHRVAALYEAVTAAPSRTATEGATPGAGE